MRSSARGPVTACPSRPRKRAPCGSSTRSPREIAGGHAYGRFQWTYTGNMLNGVSHPRTLQPAYQIADFKVGLESEDWEIYVYVDNVTDERAILIDRENALVPGTVSINRPRTWGLGFSKSWGGT